MDRLLRNKGTILLLVGPAMCVYGFIMLYPIVASVRYSFYTGIPGVNLGFDAFGNYVRLFGDRTFLKVVQVTLKYTAVVVAGQILLGLVTALALSFGIRRCVSAVRTLIFFPIVLPSVALAQMFSKIYETVPQYGLLNSVLKLVGLEVLVRAWTGNVDTVLYALCAQDIWRAVGFYTVIFFAAIVEFPRDVLEAARIDGARALVYFRHVLFPLLRPAFFVALIYCLVGTVKVFETALALTNGGPGYETTVMSLYMLKVTFLYSEYGRGSAIAVVLFVACLVITVVMNRYVRGVYE